MEECTQMCGFISKSDPFFLSRILFWGRFLILKHVQVFDMFFVSRKKSLSQDRIVLEFVPHMIPREIYRFV